MGSSLYLFKYYETNVYSTFVNVRRFAAWGILVEEMWQL